MASARAMPTRCFMPPEISIGRLSLACAICTSSRLCMVQSWRSLRDLVAREHLVDGEAHVVVDGEPGQQRVVLEHHGAIGPGLVDLLVLEQHRAARDVEQAGDDVEQGRLAAAGMADDGDVLALLDAEIDVGQDLARSRSRARTTWRRGRCAGTAGPARAPGRGVRDGGNGCDHGCLLRSLAAPRVAKWPTSATRRSSTKPMTPM